MTNGGGGGGGGDGGGGFSSHVGFWERVRRLALIPYLFFFSF